MRVWLLLSAVVEDVECCCGLWCVGVLVCWCVDVRCRWCRCCATAGVPAVCDATPGVVGDDDIVVAVGTEVGDGVKTLRRGLVVAVCVLVCCCVLLCGVGVVCVVECCCVLLG